MPFYLNFDSATLKILGGIIFGAFNPDEGRG
jgi:hypothetical protein